MILKESPDHGPNNYLLVLYINGPENAIPQNVRSNFLFLRCLGVTFTENGWVGIMTMVSNNKQQRM